MTRLKCSDYGFECDFIASGELGNVAIQFSEHSEHVSTELNIQLKP